MDNTDAVPKPLVAVAALLVLVACALVASFVLGGGGESPDSSVTTGGCEVTSCSPAGDGGGAAPGSSTPDSVGHEPTTEERPLSNDGKGVATEGRPATASAPDGSDVVEREGTDEAADEPSTTTETHGEAGDETNRTTVDGGNDGTGGDDGTDGQTGGDADDGSENRTDDTTDIGGENTTDTGGENTTDTGGENTTDDSGGETPPWADVTLECASFHVETNVERATVEVDVLDLSTGGTTTTTTTVTGASTVSLGDLGGLVGVNLDVAVVEEVRVLGGDGTVLAADSNDVGLCVETLGIDVASVDADLALDLGLLPDLQASASAGELTTLTAELSGDQLVLLDDALGDGSVSDGELAEIVEALEEGAITAGELTDALLSDDVGDALDTLLGGLIL